MMDSSLYLHMFLILCCCNLNILANSYSSMQPLCHEDERSALLQFKHSFVIKKFASSDDPSAYPKVESWNLDVNTRDCCTWDGVECDHDTGHVIGLNLNGSFLYGSINSNNNLFGLVHLWRLNLANNHFNYSQIPIEIRNLSRLRSLNLYNSFFSGQIPSEISSLSKLTFLDLSSHVDEFSREHLLKLEKPSLRDLVQNLTNVQLLDLSGVNISSTVPSALSNISSLTSLDIWNCLLYGEFPVGIFHLPNLRRLGISFNENLFGYLPEFPRGSPIEVLIIRWTSFSGLLPASIGNLNSLTLLELGSTNMYGMLPPSVGNLTQLKYLDITAGNPLWGKIPSSVANLSKLTHLGFGGGTFDAGFLHFLLGKLSKLTRLYLFNTKIGEVLPQSLANLTQLSVLVLCNNELLGEIPSWLQNLTRFTDLDLAINHLHGMLPSSISQLKHLENLDLSANNLNGKVVLDIFQNLQNYAVLQLSGNKLTVVMTNSTNATLPKFSGIGLGSCNLKEFPNFLRFQDKLQLLDLPDNSIHGQIPSWLWNTTKETMREINLHGNVLTGFEEHPDVIPWISLRLLDFSFNKLQGPLPLPPPSIRVYSIAENLLTGEIPPSFCQNMFIIALDLSNNWLSGAIPQCLASSNSDLRLLNLSGNNFHGNVPQTFTREIKMIDLSQNQLHGVVPRSLADCTMLEILVLGNNQINDTFPFWLGTLPELQVIILRFNRFHGAIENPKTSFNFPKLRIIDLSHNGFSGTLPSMYFQNWNAMKVAAKGNSAYMEVLKTDWVRFGNINYEWVFTYSITLSSKGNNRFYSGIQSAFVVVDLSCNKFNGEIPESLGSLSGLQLLNISKNNLTSVIPSSFANLTDLESLDISQNLLSGEIPQQLTQLTFLSVLNLSRNRLTGPIPHGKQFDTFDNSSYGGNMGLCGVPLTILCRNSEPSLPPPPVHSSQGNDLEFPIGIYWMVIIMGYGSGLIIGLVIGHMLTTRYHEWFVAIFERGKKTKKMQKRRGRRN